MYTLKGWVASDIHFKSASWTLDYANPSIQHSLCSDTLQEISDHDLAVATFAAALDNTLDADHLGTRLYTAYKSMFDNNTCFMEARNASGAWVGHTQGWTEGDMWAYIFGVPHDVPCLIVFKGGNVSFVDFLGQNSDGGHNAHTNEVSRYVVVE